MNVIGFVGVERVRRRGAGARGTEDSRCQRGAFRAIEDNATHFATPRHDCQRNVVVRRKGRFQRWKIPSHIDCCVLYVVVEVLCSGGMQNAGPKDPPVKQRSAHAGGGLLINVQFQKKCLSNKTRQCVSFALFSTLGNSVV